MQYSKLLFVLPLASATVLKRDLVMEYQTVTDVETNIVTVTAGQAPATDVSVQAAPTDGGHGHQQFHSYNPASNYQPAAYPTDLPPAPAPAPAAPAPAPAPAAPAPAPAAPAPGPASAPSSDNGGSGGCPADTSGQHMSPSVDAQGNVLPGPGKSMIDSMNYMRRLFNPSATCLAWSDSLAQASQNCANQGSEVGCCRPNSNVISDTKYGQDGVKHEMAKSQFEGALFMLMCQDPGLKPLADNGVCGNGKTGESAYDSSGNLHPACTGENCDGHAQAILDTAGTNNFMGVGVNMGFPYMSVSFSKTNGIYE